MNKLLFTLKLDFDEDIILIANNHKDLEDYLTKNYDFYKVEVKNDIVDVKISEDCGINFATLEWAKHI